MPHRSPGAEVSKSSNRSISWEMLHLSKQNCVSMCCVYVFLSLREHGAIPRFLGFGVATLQRYNNNNNNNDNNNNHHHHEVLRLGCFVKVEAMLVQRGPLRHLGSRPEVFLPRLMRLLPRNAP
eukprot:3269346-Amphidinium_carterae.1